MSIIDNIKKALNKQPAKAGNMSFGAEYSITDTPTIKEVKGKEWVSYGEDNLYPQRLKELLTGSPIHNAIVKTKAIITAGDGFLINKANSEQESVAEYEKLDAVTKELYDAFIKNGLDQDNLKSVVSKLALDFHTYGAFAYERIWNIDFTRIVRIKYVKAVNVRSGKYEGDKIKSYFVSRDWADSKKGNFKPVEIPAPGFGKNASELIYEKVGDLDYYGTPSYIGAITWIQVDCQMGIYHLANIENGMNPGLFVKFYEIPGTDQAKQEILDGVRSNYKGAKKTGKTWYSFSDSKETAPDVVPVQASNLDKQQLLLAELCDKKILTGHQLTSPLLVGISVSGSIGGNVELKSAFQLFDNVVMSLSREMICNSFKKNILEVNKIGIEWEINRYDPFKEQAVADASNAVTSAINSLSPLVANKVLESMTADEIRSLIGLPATGAITPTA